MGLMLSIVISYAGVNEAIECVKHIIRGVVPDDDPNFEELVDYYTRLLNKSANPSLPGDWIKECGQGYLSLTADKDGVLKSAAVQYYGQTRSTAILFSTKISSFGQESIDEGAQVNGDYRTDRYTPTKTKTIISTNTSESFSIGPRNRLSTPQNTLESVVDESTENDNELNDLAADREKLSWHYKPKSPTRKPLPEIHFQSFDADRVENTAYSEEFLRSLDGIKFRPLQRNDPSGRRRSFRKRHSSSSNSSRDSKASRDEELKMFTSLEEEEFRRMNEGDKSGRYGSTPNLTRSYSRSRSREKSRDRTERWSTEATFDTPDEERPKLKDLPKLDSFAEERDVNKVANEVTEETEEEVDFWANIGD